jgi:Plasmid pRiA4b ORF-3-like protein
VRRNGAGYCSAASSQHNILKIENTVMAILKFRVYFAEDDSVYRDVAIRHSQNFLQLHQAVLKAYEFDSKHQATFYRSNDQWQRGKEITLAKYDKPYKVEPLLMEATTIGSEIKDPNQKFVYVYDFIKNWSFWLELINVSKEENPRIEYPATVRTEGIAPSQYGTKGLVSDKLAEMEEKYDLVTGAEGFGEEGEDGETDTEPAGEDAGEETTEEI